FTCYFCSMMPLRITYLFTLLIIIFLNTEDLFAQVRQTQIQTTSKLALSYYNDREYEKAATHLLEAYHLSHNSYYFRLYLNSMIELKQFEKAEAQIQTEIKEKPAQ